MTHFELTEARGCCEAIGEAPGTHSVSAGAVDVAGDGHGLRDGAEGRRKERRRSLCHRYVIVEN